MPDFYPILPGSALAPGGAEEVGNKAWMLMRMAGAGLPVPPAMVLPTSWCRRPAAEREPGLTETLKAVVARLEAATGLGFGAVRRPLLLSVRSGAAISMPGMMETVLDVGLNEASVQALVRSSGNPRLAWDSYRRLVQGYAEVVAALPVAPFDELTAAAVALAKLDSARELDFLELRKLTRDMLDRYQALAGEPFPADPFDQLTGAAQAVLRSWDSAKAVSYRRLNGIADGLGTAVTVQTMVFGNGGNRSGSGVGFTHDPATGGRELYFDFQFNAQGEDVVAGRHRLRDDARLEGELPAIWAQLQALRLELETLFRDAQDFEFTVQSGTLFLLQARRAKRTAWAALAIAVDMVAEGILTPDEGLAQLEGIPLDSVVRSRFAAPVPATLAVAQVASIGVASGAIALDSAAVKRSVGEGNPAILVRRDTDTSDIEGMALAAGILTGSGGRTSHAAVVARQLDKVCLVACPGLVIDLDRRQCAIGATRLNEGDFISLDGNSGNVHQGRLTLVTERPEAALAVIAGWRAASVAAPL